MTETPTPPPERTPEEERRSKLIGRAFVIGLLILVAIYVAPVLIGRLS
ncbi:hypothetical protein [Phenylobacterium deserti]|nr:hypothetical protein [Phenylobacterium deserti]